MREVSHKQAHRLILAETDDLLEKKERRVLLDHLAACPSCRAYASNLDRLHQSIGRSLHNRWDYMTDPILRPTQFNDPQMIAKRAGRDRIMRQSKSFVRYALGLLMLFLLTVSGILIWESLSLPSLVITPASPTEKSSPTDKIILTLAVQESELAGYRPLIELFEAQHPNIHVELVAEADLIPFETSDRIDALARVADIFLYFPDLQDRREYLFDLEPLLSLDLSFQPDDFLPGLLDLQGSVWSLPVSASYPLIFFDKTAFDAAGLAYPEPGWTLEEFLYTAQALTIRDGERVTRWGYVPFSVQPLLSVQLSTPLLISDIPRFTDPEVASTVQWTADLFTAHQVSPWLDVYRPAGARIGSGPTPWDLVDNAQAAMWSRGHGAWQYVQEGDRVGVTTLPRSERGYAIEPIQYAFAVSRGTANPHAAWLLLNFLNQQPPVDAMFEFLVPARRSVAAAAGFWERLPETLAAPLKYASDNNAGRRDAGELLPALMAIIERELSVADALIELHTASVSKIAETQAGLDAPAPVVTPQSTEGVTKVVFAASWNETEAIRALAKLFNQDHPEINVTVRRIDTDVNFFQEVSGADCFTGGVINDQLASRVRPLDPLFDLDPDITPKDFFPGAILGLTHEGQLLGIPGWINAPLIQYNQELFVEAGLPEPSPGWSLDEFLQTAEALTNQAAGQYGFMDWSQWSTISFGPAQFGVKLVDRRQGVAAIDFTAAAPMLGWYVDLITAYGVHPSLPGYLKDWSDYFDRYNLFQEWVQAGRVAMWIYTQEDPTWRPRVETGFAPVPRGPSGYSFGLVDGLTAYYIAADTPHANACWGWMKYLSTQPTVITAPNLPAHIATARSAAYVGHVGNEMAAVLLEAIQGGSNQAYLAEMRGEGWLTPGWIWLAAAAERAAKGKATLELALAEAEEMFNKYRECVIDRQAFDKNWSECAVQVDPELAERYGIELDDH